MTENTMSLEKAQNKSLSAKDQVKDLLEKNREFISQALPKHMTAERMLRCAITAYTTTPGLKDCHLPSLIGGIVQCTIIGLEPNTPLGHAYLIPFNNRKKNRKEVQVIFGYPGLIELMRRSGQVISVNAGVVRSGDLFEFEYGLNEKLKHIPTQDGGTITYFYAYVKLKDGGQQFTVMTRSEVDGLMSKTQSKGQYGPWKDDYPEMGKKTAIRRLSKYTPKSIELATATQMDEFADLQKSQHLDTVLDGDYTLEGKDEPIEENPEQAREEVENDPFDAGYGHKLDINGEIWDQSIHATSQNGTPVWSQSGQFRRRRKTAAPKTIPDVTENSVQEPEQEQELQSMDSMSLANYKQLLDMSEDDDMEDLQDILRSINKSDHDEALALYKRRFG